MRPSIIPSALLPLLAGAVWVSCNFSTAHFSEATLSRGVDENKAPVETTSSFNKSDARLYCAVKMANTPSGTSVKAVWQHLPEGGDARSIDSTTLEVSDDVRVAFSLTLAKDALPYGNYVVRLYINDKPDRDIPFRIEPMLSAGPVKEAVIAADVAEDYFPYKQASAFAETPPVIYAAVYAVDLQQNSAITAVWRHDDGEAKVIDSAQFPGPGTGWIGFSLKPSGAFPPGPYACDILLDGALAHTLRFTIGPS